MARQRAQVIILQGDKVLFGRGIIREGEIGHFFIGGGVESYETPEEAAVRELQEEANVEGKLLFKLTGEVLGNHHTYLADIGSQVPTLGFDPEPEELAKEFSQRPLQALEWIPLHEIERFTSIDVMYFKLLLDECRSRNYLSEWFTALEKLVERHKAGNL